MRYNYGKKKLLSFQSQFCAKLATTQILIVFKPYLNHNFQRKEDNHKIPKKNPI